MATDQTQIQPSKEAETQSVFVADQDRVINYPRGMTNDQIDYDLHTNVRGNTPEDFFINFLPLKEIQQAWSAFDKNKGQILGEAISSVPAANAIASALKFEREEIDPAFKYAVTGDLEKTYKPWLDIWRESEVGKVATGESDKILSDNSWGIASPIPWFFAEFMPEQLLEFGTRASNWIGAYGIEKGVQKFGPPIIDKLMRSLPEDVSAALQKDIFGGEQKLKWAHDTLGTTPNTKTSVIQKAYRQAAEATHPDIVGGSGDEFKNVNNAYNAIIDYRKGVMSNFYDLFKSSKISGEGIKPTASPVKSRGIRLNTFPVLPEFSEGDLVRVGKESVKLLKITGNIATVNMAGKVMDLPIGQVQRMPVTGIEEYEKLQQLFDKHLDEADIIPGSDAYIKVARDKIDLLMQKYKDAVLKDYPETKEPIVANTDLFRTMDFEHFPKFESTMSKTRHAYASAAQKVFRHLILSDPKRAHLPSMITVGSAGAAKTSSLRNTFGDLSEDFRIVIDTNMASIKSGEKIVENIREYPGLDHIHFHTVYRKPASAWVNGVIKRMLKNPERRIVTVDDWLATEKSYKAILDWLEKYKGMPGRSYTFKETIDDHPQVNIDKKKLEEYVATIKPDRSFMENSVKLLNKEGKISDEELNLFLTGEANPKITQKNAKESTGGDQQGIEGVLQGKPKAGSLDEGTTGKGKSAVNVERIKASEEAKRNLEKATETVADEIENQTGVPLTHKEVIEASKSAEILSKGVSREATLAFEASLLKTRQHLAALAEQNELTPEFLDALRITANQGTDIARSLESMKISAVPEYAATKIKLIKNLIKLGKSSEEILTAAKGVDFTKERDVAQFYRQFVKPTLSEILDEFAYMNILSSPLTHIKNTFSNLIQLSGLNPITKLASGAVDVFASKLTGSERSHYISDVAPFYKGALNSMPQAIKLAGDALAGNKNLDRPDVTHLPTLSKAVDYATLGVGKYIPRALEASDIFFRTLVEAGEIEAMSERLGHTPSEKEMIAIKAKARESGDYYVFRNKPDTTNATGQGHLLTWLDKGTQAIYSLRRVPGLKWFVRFVQTPMNILKQGVEYSPAGFATLPGAKDKTEQSAKAIIGSLVFAGASWLAAAGRTTWSAPSSKNEKNDFYNAGMQPYSIRIGDNWISYSQIGPLAYPIAMASALHYFTKESPNALSDSEMDKTVDAITGIMKFFSDQSYMQGLGDMVSFAQGEKTKAIASLPTQMIPLSSLQGWVNNIIDPLQRKATSGLSMKSVMDQINMKIVGMSKAVPAQVDMEQNPVKKQYPAINAVSPVKVSKINKGAAEEYKEKVRIKQEVNKIKKDLAK